MGWIGSTKLVLPKWHKYGTYNRHFRVLINAFLQPYHTLPRKITSVLFATWQMFVLYICKTGKADYAVGCHLAQKELLISTWKVSWVPHEKSVVWHTTVYIWTIGVVDDVVLCHTMVLCVTRHILFYKHIII